MKPIATLVIVITARLGMLSQLPADSGAASSQAAMQTAATPAVKPIIWVAFHDGDNYTVGRDQVIADMPTLGKNFSAVATWYHLDLQGEYFAPLVASAKANGVKLIAGTALSNLFYDRQQQLKFNGEPAGYTGVWSVYELLNPAPWDAAAVELIRISRLCETDAVLIDGEATFLWTQNFGFWQSAENVARVRASFSELVSRLRGAGIVTVYIFHPQINTDDGIAMTAAIAPPGTINLSSWTYHPAPAAADGVGDKFTSMAARYRAASVDPANVKPGFMYPDFPIATYRTLAQQRPGWYGRSWCYLPVDKLSQMCREMQASQ